MKLEEIIHELKTLSDFGPGCETSEKEVEAMRAAIPILKRCEKYKKALEKISNEICPDSEPNSVVIAMAALDCEEN